MHFLEYFERKELERNTQGLTVNEMILSKSMTGAMWKSNTKYWTRRSFKNHSVNVFIIYNLVCDCVYFSFRQHYLIVVRAVCALLHGGELFGVPHLKVAITSINIINKWLSHYVSMKIILVGNIWWNMKIIKKTWTQTTGSILRPASCRASITVIQIWWVK